MGALAPDVLAADLRTLLDHMHKGHRVATADIEVLLQPIHDRACLDLGGVEALLLGQGDELVRRLARLRLDVVQISLEGHLWSPLELAYCFPLPLGPSDGAQLIARARTCTLPPEPQGPTRRVRRPESDAVCRRVVAIANTV